MGCGERHGWPQAVTIGLVVWSTACAPNPNFEADAGSTGMGENSSESTAAVSTDSVSTDSASTDSASGSGSAACDEPSLELDFVAGNIDPRFVFQRGGLGTYVDAQGRIQVAEATEPRLTHVCTDDGCEPRGLIVESARANEAVTDMSTWREHESNLVSSAALAPDGTMTAFELVDNEQDVEHYVSRYVGEWFDGDVWTFSVFAKAGSLNEIRVMNSTVPNWSIARFSLTDGRLISYSGGGDELDTTVDAGSEVWPDGWLRLWIAFRPPAGESRNLWLGTYDGSYTYPGEGESLFIWGPQLERGVQPTSYIPTDREPPVARDAETALVSDLSWFNPEEGTFVVDFSRARALLGDEWVMQLGDQTGVEHMGLRAIGTDMLAVEFASAGSGVERVEFPFTPTAAHRVAFAYAPGAWAAATGGSTVESHSLFDAPVGLTKLDVGDATPAASKLQGEIGLLRYYPCRRPDTELRELSTPGP